jgi:excisionase family DNA binding protein
MMQQTSEAYRALFSPDEAAAYLGVGRSQMYAMIRSGAIATFKIGRLRKVRRADLDAYIDEQLRAAQER